MINLETERLLIRNFTSNDWSGLAELGIKYEETELAIYDEGPWPDDPEKYKEIVEQMSTNDVFLAVILKENSKLIGLIYKQAKDNHGFEFGFNFHVEYHGKGYATESCKKVIDYMYKELEAEYITAGTAVVNIPSNKLLTKLGFKLVREKKMSFRKDETGNPIMFDAVDYILTEVRDIS